MQTCYAQVGYILDPHGACGYRALKEQLHDGETGIFLETAHPTKFKEKVDEILSTDIKIPERLQAFMSGKIQTIRLSADYEALKELLMRKS